jgi:hypothetical protein
MKTMACETREELYETLQRNFEGCNYVNRIIVESIQHSAPYHKFVFDSPEGFVEDQKYRAGNLIFQSRHENPPITMANWSIVSFIRELGRYYQRKDIKKGLSARLIIEDEEGKEIESVEFVC